MNRRGISLFESLLALSMLMIVVTTFARYIGTFQQGTTRATALTVATAVAKEQLELIRVDPRYTALAALYDAGASADTTGFPGYPNMRRLTDLVRDQGGTPPRDRTTITVRVTWPGMSDTVKLTTVRSRP